MSENKTKKFDIEVHFSMDSIKSLIAQEGPDETARGLGMEIIREFYRREKENESNI